LQLRVWRFLIWHIPDETLAKPGSKDIIPISQFVELALILCLNFFACIRSQTHKVDRETSAKTENLSPLRFYFEINLHFNITCIISIQNFCGSIFVDKCYFSRICDKPPFFRLCSSENLSHPRLNFKIHTNFCKR
jgi:hypothetical protein